MLRPSAFRAALAAVAAALAVLLLVLAPTLGPAVAAGLGSPAHASGAPEEDPLLVRLDALTPVAPESGAVELSGTVTNVSDEEWTDVNLLAFRSETPILDGVGLAASAASDPTAFVGPRVTEPGTYDTVELLEPGQTASFSMSVPVELLGINLEAGVYWIGVHASGASSEPRDEFADGRARTFIPYVPGGSGRLDAAFVLPLRQGLLHDADGRLGSTRWWRRALSDGGRLEGVLDTAEAAGTTPYTWLVDPAVLAAVSRLTAGNPERSLAPDPTVPGQEPSPVEPEQEQDESSELPAPDVEPTTSTPPVPERERTEAEQRLAELATGWLERLRSLTATSSVLALPFGDIDVAAAVRHEREWFDLATARSAMVMSQLGIAASPAVAPTSGSLSREAITAMPPGTTILLGDTAFAVPPPKTVVRTLGQRVVVTSGGAESGGPAPTDPHDPLAMRQRVLSEGALRLQSGSTAPLVVTLPRGWRGDAAERFFDGLDQRPLRPVALSEVADAAAVGVSARSVVYTEGDVAAELDSVHFAAARNLMDSATLLEEVLVLQTTIEAQVLDETLPTLSQLHRGRSATALDSAEAILEELRTLLGAVKIVLSGPAVTLSSDRGYFGFTLVNGLDQPVTVRVAGTTDGDLTLRGDAVRVLAPDSRVPVRWEAVATTPGIHEVRLLVASEDGTPLGSAVELPIRAARVSDLIWYLMGGATALLVGALALRLRRSVRRARESQPADAPADPPADADSSAGTRPAPAPPDGQRV